MIRSRLILLGCATVLLSCSGAGLLGGAGAGGLAGAAGACSDDFGADAAAQKLETFMSAADQFATAAADVDRSLLDACRTMGTALQLGNDVLNPASDATRTVCHAVAERLHDDVTAVRGAARVQLEVAVEPPRCEISVDAYASCAAGCDVNYHPGSAEVQCEGGELRGTCSGSCTGRCSVEASAQCTGSCEGTCSGGCSGTCQGTCEGTCSARDAQGNCNGRCSGSCRGTCSAGCSGSCQGHCVVQGQAQCSGECRGGCSVAYTAPRCTGRIVPPSVSADCRAACDARLNAQASCQPGRVSVHLVGSLTGDLQARFDRVRAALEGGFSSLLMIRDRVRRLGESGVAVVRAAGDLPGAIGALGLRAARCAGEALTGLTRAAASVNVSVQVSVEVSASASVSGG